MPGKPGIKVWIRKYGLKPIKQLITYLKNQEFP